MTKTGIANFFRRWRRHLLIAGIALPLLLLLPIAVAELWTHSLSSGRCHNSPEECQPESVGLVLGCSKYIRRGHRNYFYLKRIEAAAARCAA